MSSSLPVYRFTLEINGGAGVELHPRHETPLLEPESEAGQVFFRTDINGKLIFTRADFELLFAMNMEDEGVIIIEEFTGTWDHLYTGYFTKANFDVDEDARRISLDLITRDRYEKVLAAMDKEFDLIKLGVAKTAIEIAIQPVIQLYIPGATFLNNYLNGTWWEQPVKEPINQGAYLESVFTNDPTLVVYIPGDAGVLDPDVSGHYVYDWSGTFFGGYIRLDGAYALWWKTDESKWGIIEASTMTWVYLANASGATNNPPPGWNWKRDNGAVLYESQSSASECRAFFLYVYARILTNADTVNGNVTLEIPVGDIVEDSLNYSRMYGFTAVGLVGGSLHSADADRWGRFADDSTNFAGEYFVRASPAPGENIHYPVNRSEWTEMSLWFYFDPTAAALQEDGATFYTLKDAYKLSDVLSKLLSVIDPAVFHEEHEDYSNFIYGSSNSIRGSVKVPVITPKTNITIGTYDLPAQKAIFKLSDIMTLYDFGLNCKWYIQEDGKFVIEHRHFFENGKSYGAPGIGADLTVLLEPKSGKPWSFRTKKYKYNPVQLPEQIITKWMDDVSPPFEGYPINIRSRYAQKGNIEDRRIGLFTSDIDFMHVQPDGISKDGFAFFEAIESEGVYSLPFVEFAVTPEEVYLMQNGYASLVWMHNQYHRHQLPANLVTLNGQDIVATSTRRTKIQELEYPSGTNPDLMLLVTTTIGNGKVTKVSISLSSRSAKITLAHDTQ